MSLSGDRLNLWPSGEAKVPHAGERRHPGLFSVGQKPPGFPSGFRRNDEGVKVTAGVEQLKMLSR
jgi:hypothetical protein